MPDLEAAWHSSFFDIEMKTSLSFHIKRITSIQSTQEEAYFGPVGEGCTQRARKVARFCATFRVFLRSFDFCFNAAMLRDFIKIIADDRKRSIHMTSSFLCFATFRDFGQNPRPSRLFATLVRDFGRDCAKFKSRIDLPGSTVQNRMSWLSLALSECSTFKPVLRC
jgi:hypothetical protein